MPVTKVVNLDDSSEQIYSIPPAQAVIAAYEQSRQNWNTWDYKSPEEHPKLTYGTSGKTVSCGSFCAMLDSHHTVQTGPHTRASLEGDRQMTIAYFHLDQSVTPDELKTIKELVEQEGLSAGLKAYETGAILKVSVPNTQRARELAADFAFFRLPFSIWYIL